MNIEHIKTNLEIYSNNAVMDGRFFESAVVSSLLRSIHHLKFLSESKDENLPGYVSDEARLVLQNIEKDFE